MTEKMKNWIMPVLDIFHEVLGQSQTEYLIKMGKIEGVPLEVIKGRSF
jgi:phosphate starvation-inducible protein PhoH